jgi:NAD(P)-dependent dehydrogenase (short-subunit alcohol dehydrogenase family)
MLSGVQNALIIGASSVVGRALARILASRGYNVGLAARRLDLLRAVANEIHTMPFRRPRHAGERKQLACGPGISLQNAASAARF